MPRTILVGLDGSPYSASAMEVGIRWARRASALLVGLGIIDEPTIRQPLAVPPGAMSFKVHRDQKLLADATRKVEQYLEQFALRCAEAGVSCKLLEDVGLPGDQILLEAQRYDVILLGRESHFHFETQAIADETLASVVKHSPRPVVAVPENPAEGTSVVVAYDGSLQAARALQAFQGIGWDGSQDVHVVCVHDDRLEAARCADRAVEFLESHAIKAFPHPLSTATPPADAILDQAEMVGAGLIVMGAYGRSPLKEFFFGSVTRALLQESPVPLFLYH
jgi:nucleotide-binding universal stress UspA family protein